jgi:hypothetical protein
MLHDVSSDSCLVMFMCASINLRALSRLRWLESYCVALSHLFPGMGIKVVACVDWFSF